MRLNLTLSVSLLFATSASLAQTPSISPVPVDGDSRVTVTDATAADVGATISIFAATTPVAAADGTIPPATCTGAAVLPAAPYTTSFVLAGGQTTVLLKDPLSAGQSLCVGLTAPNAPAGTSPTMSAAAPITVAQPASPPGFDWGLERVYFTLGALTSQERDQFSHEDLFLAFHLDKGYIPFAKSKLTQPVSRSVQKHGKMVTVTTMQPVPKDGKLQFSSDHYTHRPGLNSFFDTRLTALPVAVQNCTPPAATSTTPAVICSNAATSSTSDVTSTTTSQAFLNSQKAARLAFGAYAPILLHQWHVAARSGTQTTEVPNAFFIAPLVKTGFDTTLNGLNQTQQSSSTPSAVQPIGSSSQFYKFYDFGFRSGHYGMTSDPDVAPELIDYLDVSLGRYSNLASLVCDTTKYTYSPSANTCSQISSTSTSTNTNPIPVAGSLPWSRDYRLNVEGLLQVPGTHGFSIGFSTNVVFDPLGRQGGTLLKHVRPADDLRFLFAYKFDITKLAAKLAPQFSN